MELFPSRHISAVHLFAAQTQARQPGAELSSYAITRIMQNESDKTNTEKLIKACSGVIILPSILGRNLFDYEKFLHNKKQICLHNKKMVQMFCLI